MKKIFLILSVAMSSLVLNSCRDGDLEPTLAQDKDVNISINTVEDMRSVLNSGYDRMSSYFYYGRDYIIFGEVRSDNTFSNANSNRFVTVGQMNMNVNDGYASDTWKQIYRVIGSANIVINQDLNKISGDADLAKNIKGEALVMRAFAHFDLLKLYGQQHIGTGGMSALGVPYIKTFRDPNNLLPARNTVQEVYDFAMADLNEALSLMNPALNDSSKHYFTTYAANAIKARIALYFKKYDVVEAAAAKVVNSGAYNVVEGDKFAASFKTDSYVNHVFAVANSTTDNQGNNGLANIYRGTYGDVVGLANLYNIYDATDVRRASNMMSVKIAGSEYRNVGKYPTTNTPDDIPVIRFEEVVLIYAEALLNNNKAAEALVQLNKIPANRAAATYTAATMDNILLERRKELAFEGHRFYDLARTGKSLPLVDQVRQTYGTITYGSYKYAFPIPATEMGANSKMVQNSGY